MLKKLISKILVVTTAVYSLGVVGFSSFASAEPVPQNISLDFEDMNDISDIPTQYTEAYYLNVKGNASASIETIDQNKCLRLENINSGNYRNLEVKFDENASKEKKVIFKYDIMTNDGLVRTELTYSGGNGWSPLLFLRSNWKSLHNTKVGTAGSSAIPKDGEWYHVEHEFDIKNGKFLGKITKKSDGSTILSADGYNDTIQSLKWLNLNPTSVVETVYYDNIEISYVDAKPVVTSDSVKLFADDAEQTDKTQVSQLTNSMTIDFGMDMNTETVTDENVYVTNKTTSKRVASRISECTSGVAKLIFGERLEKGSTYVLNIANVKGASGSTMEFYTPVEFTVAGTSSLPSETVAEDLNIDFENIQIENIPTTTEDKPVGKPYFLFVDHTDSDMPQIIEKDGSKVIKLVNDDNGHDRIKIPLNSEESKKVKVILKYDVMTDNDNRKFRTDLYYTGAKNNWGPLLFMASNWKSLHNGLGGTAGSSAVPAIGQWYHVEHVFDIKNGKISGTVTNRDDGTPIISVNDFNDTVMSLVQLDINARDYVGSAYWDNIQVQYVYDKPIIDENSIDVINPSGDVQDNWTNISLLTKAVQIDFKTVMDTSTLTDDNIYLENVTTGEKVPVVFEYSDGVLKLNLTKKLSAKTNYKLVISDAVKNVRGDKVEGYTNPLVFTTGESVRTAVVTGVYKGSDKVNKLNQISKDDSLAINVSYANSTSEPSTVNILIAYYNNGALEKAELVKTENISADIETMKYTYNHTVSDLTGITKIKVFSWDSLSNLKPMSNSYTVD